MSIRSAATFQRLERHHDAKIVSRTWLGSTGSAVRNRSRFVASRSPVASLGRAVTLRDMRLLASSPAHPDGEMGTDLGGPGGQGSFLTFKISTPWQTTVSS